MKILKLTAENIKRLTAVEITPDGSIVKISGKNASGKTSVLDSIWWAMGGGKNIQDQPVHKGAKEGKITLDLGDLQVERRFTEKGTQLFVTTKSGARHPRPQDMLDSLVGMLAFDPLEFMRLKPKEQLNQLRSIVGIGDELDVLDTDRKVAYENRTVINRDLKQKQGALTQYEDIPEGTSSEVVASAELLDKIEAAEAVNQSNKEASDAFGRAKTQEVALASELVVLSDGMKTEIPRLTNGLEEQIAALERNYQATIDRLNTAVKAKQEIYDAAVKVTTDLSGQVNNRTDVDITPLRDELNGLEDANNLARRVQAWEDITENVAKLKHDSEIQTSVIENIDAKKVELMAATKFPTDGLAFQDGEVMYNDLPLDQASSAEQLRVSMSIAMSANPEFRVIRITDGSLMDSESFALIEKMAEDKDYQIWVEVVDETGEVGVVIEDGQVVKVN